MLSNFKADLQKAKKAEELVRDVFSSLTSEYVFEDVSNDRCFYYRGDIKATAADGREIFIEVKDDSVIWRTQNVLCEEEVYYKHDDFYGKGNMQSDYDIYCVVSWKENKIYVIDFSILRTNYNKGEFKIIDHPAQTTYCYLCSISQIKSWGGLITVVDLSQ